MRLIELEPADYDEQRIFFQRTLDEEDNIVLVSNLLPELRPIGLLELFAPRIVRNNEETLIRS